MGKNMFPPASKLKSSSSSTPEMYRAYKQGRLATDPSLGWYQGEIGFFDFYIIPLAKKLFTCGVFGVSSDEFLNYANINRKGMRRCLPPF